MTEVLRQSKQPDGSLSPADQWMNWKPGMEQVQLDGWFFADDLRAIADHMDKANAEIKKAGPEGPAQV